MTINTKNPPLVILALDTGDYDAIQEWTAQGYLPAIASIMQRGCWGKTAGPELVCEYGVGLTLFSGISRAQHGYYYFRQLESGTYNLKNLSPEDFNIPPFWSHMQRKDKKVLIVDVPDIYPVPGLPGFQLSNWATHHGSSELPSAEPAELLDEVKRVFGSQIIVDGNPKTSFQEDLRIYDRLLKRIEKKGKLCQHLLCRDNVDLITIFFSESDPASHYFWKYRPEAGANGKETKKKELRHGLRDIYQAIDEQIGHILAQLPKDANVFILSLYGIQDEYPTSTLIESFCRQLGYHVAPEADNGSFSLNPIALARQIVPESWRLGISRFLPQSTQERLLAHQLSSNTDWRKTTAFAIPSLFTSFVRVNLRGREPHGIVEPGTDYQVLLDRFETDLKQLVDPQSGKPAVKQVTRTAELFQSGPPDSLPDLFVEWQPGPRFLERVVHPRSTLIQPKPEYCPDSQEKLSGFVAAAGPSVHARGAIGDVQVLDLAPTFLSLLGQPIPDQMRGNVLNEVVRREKSD